MSTRYLVGIHAVREALRARTALRFVAVSRERHDPRLQELITLAHAARVPLRRVGVAELERWAGRTPHQGVVAEAEAKAVLELEDLLADAPQRLLLALDGIEDPHNLGAIVRSACGAGVDGVLLPARRAAGLTETVERVSAGALEHVRVARVGNLAQALEQCKQAGFWIVGLDGEAKTRLWDHDFREPTVVVVGAEGRGLHALIRQRCDARVAIPLAAGVDSLNASVAAGIALFEVARQRSGGGRPVG
ncbi:MAG TPA: 23S rRNA (guanosine(2251)-2'-O)-methyltransferase RlmB [Terriglobales bacterium]|nr:23S rRNA (guanosine(2251)-2'-O)-methyltransferase RlmB [Terriglobales bacterium]